MNVYELLEYGVIVAAASDTNFPDENFVVTWEPSSDAFNILKGDAKGVFEEYDYSVIEVADVIEAAEMGQQIINEIIEG